MRCSLIIRRLYSLAFSAYSDSCSGVRINGSGILTSRSCDIHPLAGQKFKHSDRSYNALTGICEDAQLRYLQTGASYDITGDGGENIE